MKKVRLIIADDHAVFRNALRFLLSQQEDFDVVAEAGDEAETVNAVERHLVDVLILDMNMPPGMAGPRIAKAALKAKPELNIVVLTMHEDRYYVQDMFRLGAKGFVLKKSSEDELIQAIRMVHQGQRHIDSALIDDAVSNYTGSTPNRGMVVTSSDKLTPREKEICRFLAHGHTNGEIAGMLNISERTVQTHRQNIMGKLGLRGRAELVTFSIENGLFTPPS